MLTEEHKRFKANISGRDVRQDWCVEIEIFAEYENILIQISLPPE